MSKPKRRRISDLFWELVDGEPPTPTPEELEELKNAMLDPEAEVSDNLKYAVKILRRDTARLNASLDETPEEREARLAKARERTRAWRERRDARDGGDTCDKCDETSQTSQESQSVTPVTPTNQRDNQLTNQRTNNSCPAKPDMRKFVPPTVEEVSAYIKEKGYHFSAEAFVAFYESKGWMVGKNKMQKWKSACATWEQGRGVAGGRASGHYEGQTPATPEEVREYGGLL